MLSERDVYFLQLRATPPKNLADMVVQTNEAIIQDMQNHVNIAAAELAIIEEHARKGDPRALHELQARTGRQNPNSTGIIMAHNDLRNLNPKNLKGN